MKYILIITLIALAGCGPYERTRYSFEHNCGLDTAKDRSEFILQCIANGNPKSDEEPEGWILLCGVMAKDTMCSKAEFIVQESRPSAGGRWTVGSKILKAAHE